MNPSTASVRPDNLSTSIASKSRTHMPCFAYPVQPARNRAVLFEFKRLFQTSGIKFGIVILFFTLWAAAPAFAQTYTIRAIGAAPVPSTFSSVGKAVNNKDEVIGDGVFGPYNGTPSIFLPAADYGMPSGLDYLPFYGFTNFTGLYSR